MYGTIIIFAVTLTSPSSHVERRTAETKAGRKMQKQTNTPKANKQPTWPRTSVPLRKIIGRPQQAANKSVVPKNPARPHNGHNTLPQDDAP